MDQSHRERPITHPSVPQKPEQGKQSDQAREGNTVVRTAGPPYYFTHTKLFVQETGVELGFASGTEVEIRGQITSNGQVKMVNTNLPEKTNFSDQNGGLGVLVCEMTVQTINVPAQTRGTLYEEGGWGVGDRYFTDWTLDWNTAPSAWMNGWWYSTQTVSNDQNFIGHLWWQITLL